MALWEQAVLWKCLNSPLESIGWRETVCFSPPESCMVHRKQERHGKDDENDKTLSSLNTFYLFFLSPLAVQLPHPFHKIFPLRFADVFHISHFEHLSIANDGYRVDHLFQLLNFVCGDDKGLSR